MAQQLNIGQQVGAAWAAHREGDNTTAEQAFEKAIKMQPDSVDAHYGLGLVLRAQGRNDQAIDEFQTALRLAKEALEAVRTIGEAKGNISTTNDIGSTDDDRYMMLSRMITQRLSEMGVEA